MCTEANADQFKRGSGKRERERERERIWKELGGKFKRQAGNKIVKHFLCRERGSTGACTEEDFRRKNQQSLGQSLGRVRNRLEKGKEKRQGCHSVLE